MVAVALLACALAVAAGSESSPSVTPEAIGYRVRAIDARSQAWIRAGASGSATFRSLLARLSKGDLIVYVVTVDRISGGAAGQLFFVTATPRARYVRIEVAADRNLKDMVALVGHELQHAVEIADAPRVRSPQSMALLYLGMPENSFRSQYDSVAARVTESRIRNEFAGYRAGPPSNPEGQSLAALARGRSSLRE